MSRSVSVVSAVDATSQAWRRYLISGFSAVQVVWWQCATYALTELAGRSRRTPMLSVQDVSHEQRDGTHVLLLIRIRRPEFEQVVSRERMPLLGKH